MLFITMYFFVTCGAVYCRYMLFTAVHCSYYNVHCANSESLLEVRRVYAVNQRRKRGGGRVVVGNGIVIPPTPNWRYLDIWTILCKRCTFRKKAHTSISGKDCIFTMRPHLIIICMTNRLFFPT